MCDIIFIGNLLRFSIILFVVVIFLLILYMVFKSWELYYYLKKEGKIESGQLINYSYYFNDADCEDLMIYRIKIKIKYLFELLKKIMLLFALSTVFFITFSYFILVINRKYQNYRHPIIY